MKIIGMNIAIFSKNLREFRKGLKLSQEDFGRLTGKEQKTISNYEKGNTEPDFDFLIKLHDMNCDLNWLITGKGEKPIADSNTLSFQVLSKIESLEEKIDRLEKNNETFLHIPTKVEFIGSQIEAIHKKITTGNEKMFNFTEDVSKHSEEALKIIYKTLGKRRSGVPPLPMPSRKNKEGEGNDI